MLMSTASPIWDEVFDCIPKAWYSTCLPTDRKQPPSPTMHESARQFLTSPIVAQFILKRFDPGVASRLPILRQHAQRYIDALLRTNGETPDSMMEEDLASYRLLLSHQVRLLQFPTTLDEMQQQLHTQADWMWGQFTVKERSRIVEMAAWCARHKCGTCRHHDTTHASGYCACRYGQE